MRVRFLGVALLTAVLAIGGTASAAAPDSAPHRSCRLDVAGPDPVGTFQFRSQHGGRSFTGVIHVTRTETGEYGGSVSTPLTGALSIRAVAVRENTIRITAVGQAGDAVLTLSLDGKEFQGSWAYAGATGSLKGQRQG